MILYVNVKGLWSIQLAKEEKQHIGNDVVCGCKGCIEYTVSLGRERTEEHTS